jgi:glutaredoxin
VRLRLVSRQGCHLCTEAGAALAQAGVAYDVVDVDSDVELARLYDFRVPVLLEGDDVLLEGVITPAGIARALGSRR